MLNCEFREEILEPVNTDEKQLERRAHCYVIVSFPLPLPQLASQVKETVLSSHPILEE